ncbi:MAG: LCP family protein [Lachnospiraceae bacterium]|nr:LCP family protein [Lachnospiraceae bacterium]MBP3352906.1 LCP family protein [Lachnospiraceae bacterium]
MAAGVNHAKGKNVGKSKAKIIIFAVELLIIAVMLALVWKVFQTTEAAEGPHMVELQEEDIKINPEVQNSMNQAANKDGEKSKGYWNIALFGVDATKSEQLYKGSRSDTIMIASINMDSGEIKLVSVYRDTYLNRGNDTYGKCNAAYAYNGAAQAMSMLNTNLDLAITDFVAVNYQAIKEAVDGLGGVWIDVDKEEIKHINNYQITIVEDTDIPKSEYIAVKETGYQLLNGLQAAAYCRIRYGGGDDFKRTARQRELIKAMEAQAKTKSVGELTDLLPKVLKYVYTDIDETDMVELLKNITKYTIVEEGGFPLEEYRVVETIGKAHGSCIVPLDLEKNVVWLHEFLFEEEGYQVSDVVKECSQKIQKDTAPYLK